MATEYQLKRSSYFLCLRPVSDSRVLAEHGTDSGQLVSDPLHHVELVTRRFLRVEKFKTLGEVESEHLALVGKEGHVGFLKCGYLCTGEREKEKEREREREREREYNHQGFVYMTVQ